MKNEKIKKRIIVNSFQVIGIEKILCDDDEVRERDRERKREIKKEREIKREIERGWVSLNVL